MILLFVLKYILVRLQKYIYLINIYNIYVVFIH